ncbi:MAG TPA: hypothetical protein VEI50_15040 [Nitrospiraceae bacterium]|nr:hypothetical protein [Nitrospiraceae bacterium]
MTGDRKKILVLIVLALLWGGVIARQWLTAAEPTRVPLTNVTGLTTVTSSLRAPAGGLQVHLDLLAAARTQRAMAFTAPRNIFALPRVDGQPISSASQEIVDVTSDEAARQQTVVSVLSQFRYLGFIRMEQDRRPNAAMAVLTRDDDVHVVRAGQTVVDQVIVKTITPDSVTLQDRASRLEQMVPLSEETVGQP